MIHPWPGFRLIRGGLRVGPPSVPGPTAPVANLEAPGERVTRGFESEPAVSFDLAFFVFKREYIVFHTALQGKLAAGPVATSDRISSLLELDRADRGAPFTLKRTAGNTARRMRASYELLVRATRGVSIRASFSDRFSNTVLVSVLFSENTVDLQAIVLIAPGENAVTFSPGLSLGRSNLPWATTTLKESTVPKPESAAPARGPA